MFFYMIYMFIVDSVLKLGLININTIKNLKIREAFFYKIRKVFLLQSANNVLVNKGI